MVQHGSVLHSDALMGKLMGETVHMGLQIYIYSIALLELGAYYFSRPAQYHAWVPFC